jgi:transposase-like protein
MTFWSTENEMAKNEAVPNRQYTDELKIEMVRLAQSIGGNASAKILAERVTATRPSHLVR